MNSNPVCRHSPFSFLSLSRHLLNYFYEQSTVLRKEGIIMGKVYLLSAVLEQNQKHGCSKREKWFISSLRTRLGIYREEKNGILGGEGEEEGRDQGMTLWAI